MEAVWMLWAFLALSDGVGTLLGVVSGVAAFITAVVGLLIYRDNRRSKNNKKDIDLLTIGQGSLKAALDRADLENKELRFRLSKAEDHIEKQDLVIADLRAEIAKLKGAA